MLLLVAILLGLSVRISAPLFETVFSVLLLTPVVWFLGMTLFGSALAIPTSGTIAVILYLISVAVLLGLLEYLCGRRLKLPKIEEYSPFVVFTGIFLLASVYANSWPDFIAIGERLRDYSLLSATIASPVRPIEPWMSGVVLNYYVYWYRFGHFLSTILSLEVWSVYATMTAFAIAFFGAAVFEVVRKIGGLSIFVSLIAAVIVTFGSNVAGVILAYNKDANWWGPSRVVKGAINEFPAWSFILGDLHPHYVNLGLIPLLLLVLYSLVSQKKYTPAIVAASCLIPFVGILWSFAANAWEVPMFFGVLLSIAASAVALNMGSIKRAVKKFLSAQSTGSIVLALSSTMLLLISAVAIITFRKSIPLLAIFAIAVVSGGVWWTLFPYVGQIITWMKQTTSKLDPKGITVLCSGLMICIALKLSSSHIVPEGGVLKHVAAPIPLTTISELLLHWGAPLFFLCLGSILLLPRLTEKLIAAMLLASALLIDSGAAFLYVVLGLQLIRLVSVAKRPSDREVSNYFIEGISVASIALILLPEAVFLDDPYGGENERMNTIFKVYAVAWGLLHISAIVVFSKGVLALAQLLPKDSGGKEVFKVAGGIVGVVSMGVLLFFFFHATPLRKQPASVTILEPKEEGLSEIEQRFPGSVAIIKQLRRNQDGVVLEAQGNAYDYTTFVSTLSGHTAYLGWANHVNLLGKKFLDGQPRNGIYAEVSHREEVTRKIYSTGDCSERRALANSEGISFIVLGQLEKAKYPGVDASSFSCFESIARDGSYELYSIRN